MNSNDNSAPAPADATVDSAGNGGSNAEHLPKRRAKSAQRRRGANRNAADLTAERLRELLDYDPGTGIFTNRTRRSTNTVVGAQAGYAKRAGYRVIRLDRILYYANRLAWLYVHGEWPKGMVDHADGDPSNDRIGNLRDATRAQNGWNAGVRADNTSGHRGVHWSKIHERWVASIQVNGRRTCLGYFADITAAAKAYDAAAARLFGAYARTNEPLRPRLTEDCKTTAPRSSPSAAPH